MFYITLSICLLFSEDSSLKKLPDFKLKTLNKKKVDLKDFYKDGPIAVNVWNMSCEPCKKEMKYLNEYHKKLKEGKINPSMMGNVNLEVEAEKLGNFFNKLIKYSRWFKLSLEDDDKLELVFDAKFNPAN